MQFCPYTKRTTRVYGGPRDDLLLLTGIALGQWAIATARQVDCNLQLPRGWSAGADPRLVGVEAWGKSPAVGVAPASCSARADSYCLTKSARTVPLSFSVDPVTGKENAGRVLEFLAPFPGSCQGAVDDKA